MEFDNNGNNCLTEKNIRVYGPKQVSAVKYPGTYYENVSEIMKALAAITYIEIIPENDEEHVLIRLKNTTTEGVKI